MGSRTLYTPGVFEKINADLKVFGRFRLMNVGQAPPAAPPKERIAPGMMCLPNTRRGHRSETIELRDYCFIWIALLDQADPVLRYNPA